MAFGAGVLDTYNWLIHDLADKRTANYILVSNPFKVVAVIGCYLYFVTKLGPRLMQNRKPFDLRNIMIIYNILQVVLNAFIFFEGYKLIWSLNKPDMLCLPMDMSTTPEAIYITKLVHMYYMIKYLDLLDTVFMVLRKRNSHISFLHLYHHAGMVALTWGANKYFPGGHGTFVGFVNSFIHMIMYTYYLVTIIKPPSNGGQIWWKKYLTIMQMMQFIAIAIHQSLPAIIPDCKFTMAGPIVLVPQQFIILNLFWKFYRLNYTSIKNSKVDMNPKQSKTE